MPVPETDPEFTPPAVDAAALCRVALAAVGREWPFHAPLWLDGPDDLVLPRQRHPVFHTSYDWHSCVHMHWSLARLLRLHGDRLDADVQCAIAAHFDRRFTATAVAGECALFERPGLRAFERPYGWAWLLELQAELHRLADRSGQSNAGPNAGPSADPSADSPGFACTDSPVDAMIATLRYRDWRDTLAPLADRLALALLDHLPRLDYPVRAGTHASTAFACVLAFDYARTCAHPALARAIVASAHRWFGRDRRYPAAYEPGGEDFLSPGLIEALLMYRVLDSCDFADWWQAFEPAPDALAHWLMPVRVSDASDARIVHLHGLNLSRAWCWAALLPGLPSALQAPVARAQAAQRDASSAAAVDGDYAATHWLASFALLADGGACP